MRCLAVTLIAAVAALSAGVVGSAAVENCRTGDSALCASDPNCHWDFERRGCYQGAAEYIDPCAVHGGKEICNADTAIGCKWNADTSKCEQAK
jgi:hypothetical protein